MNIILLVLAWIVIGALYIALFTAVYREIKSWKRR